MAAVERWGSEEGRGAFKKGLPGISACAPAGKVAEILGGRCGSAGKTELTAWVPRVNGRGATRSCWRVGLRFGVDAAERSAEGKRGAGPRATRGVARVL